MQDFKELICPNCQGSNFVTVGDICTCKYCLSNFTKKQIDSKVFVDLRIANFERNSANFDKAKKLYSEIIKNNPEEDLSDVYFGQFLCEQRVLFEEDGKGEKFPSFYRMNLDEESTVDDSPSFAKALSYALKHNRNRLESFNTLADKIDDARKMYFDIQSKTKPFDIFICFKNSDEKGNHTPDRELAMDIYNELSSKYNIFFSEKTLKNIKSNYREYEPNIYYGLYTAKVMLLICSKKEYLESQWLKNEWSRFTQINKQGQNEKCIIPIFTDNFNPNDLPDELWHTQGIFDDRKLMTTLETTLDNILHPIDKLEELKKQQEEELKKQREELAKQQEKYAFFENFIREQQEKEEKRKLEEKQKEEKENQKLNQEKERLDLEKQKLELERKNLEKERQKELEKQNNLLEELDKRLKQTAPTQSSEPSKQTNINAPKLNFDESLATFGTYDEKKITWRVLEKKGNTVKLIADKILDIEPFNVYLSKASNKFAESDIYKWLNNNFYNKAFTDDEKPYILNSKNSDAEGKVLLLDSLECKNIGFEDRKRTFHNANKFSAKPRWWWLSSPSGKYSGYPIIINDNGYQTETRSINPNGVVPVITVALELSESEIKKFKDNLKKNELQKEQEKLKQEEKTLKDENKAKQNEASVKQTITEQKNIEPDKKPIFNKDKTMVTFGQYIQNAKVKTPITWNVLEIKNNTAKIVSNIALDVQLFDQTSNDYSTSFIRKWLNETFFNEAFTSQEKKYIVETTHELGKDNVFLLSRTEIEKLSQSQRIKKVSIFSKRKCITDENNNISWLLRTPGINNTASYIDEEGNLYGGALIQYAKKGIVPAITIKIEN